MMVVAREKREHKKEVVMMVANKKEKTTRGGGGVEKLTKLGCCGVVVTVHPRTTIMTSFPTSALVCVGSCEPHTPILNSICQWNLLMRFNLTWFFHY
jgi:hypothetical protein